MHTKAVFRFIYSAKSSTPASPRVFPDRSIAVNVVVAERLLFDVEFDDEDESKAGVSVRNVGDEVLFPPEDDVNPNCGNKLD